MVGALTSYLSCGFRASDCRLKEFYRTADLGLADQPELGAGRDFGRDSFRTANRRPTCLLKICKSNCWDLRRLPLFYKPQTLFDCSSNGDLDSDSASKRDLLGDGDEPICSLWVELPVRGSATLLPVLIPTCGRFGGRRAGKKTSGIRSACS